MSHQAANDDIRAKIGVRSLDMSVRSNDLVFSYADGCTVYINQDEIVYYLIRQHKTMVGFSVPQTLHPTFARPLNTVSLSIPPEMSRHFATRLGDQVVVLDTSKAAHTIPTDCNRSSLHFFDGGSVVACLPRSCVHLPSVSVVVLQRTKGGMSTYDAHIMQDSSDKITTVELLPHSSMDVWDVLPDTVHVIDAGPDPLPLSLVSELYDRESGRWCTDIDGSDASDDGGSESCLSSCDDNMEEGESSSEYEQLSSEEEESSSEDDEQPSSEDDELISEDDEQSSSEDG